MPVNFRLFEDQIAWIVTHSGARVLFVDAGLSSVLAPVRDRLIGVERFVVIEDGEAVDPAFAGDPRYEDLLAAQEPDHSPVRAEEGDALGLLLHERHHRPPEGRPLLPPLHGAALARAALPRQPPHLARGHDPADHRGLPRALLEPALRGRAGRRRLRLAGAAQRPRAHRAPDRGGAGHGHGRRSDAVGRDGADLRARRARPLVAARAAGRGRAGAARARAPLSPARHLDRPGLGHDRDVAERHDVARVRRGRGLRAAGTDDGADPPAPLRRGGARAALGRRDRRRAGGARALRRKRLLRARRPAGARALPRRLAAHRRPRADRPERQRRDRRPRQGPREVGRRVDQLGRARGRDRVASGRGRGGRDRGAPSEVGRAPARPRRGPSGREP